MSAHPKRQLPLPMAGSKRLSKRWRPTRAYVLEVERLLIQGRIDNARLRERVRLMEWQR